MTEAAARRFYRDGFRNVGLDQLLADDFNGCIFVHAAMEYSLLCDPVHVTAAHHKKMLEQMVHDLAVEVGAANPHQMARELCLIMEGAYVTRQLTGEKESAAIARRLGELIIEAHLPHSVCAAASTAFQPAVT